MTGHTTTNQNQAASMDNGIGVEAQTGGSAGGWHCIIIFESDKFLE
jgi:hypothetical protein